MRAQEEDVKNLLVRNLSGKGVTVTSPPIAEKNLFFKKNDKNNSS